MSSGKAFQTATEAVDMRLERKLVTLNLVTISAVAGGDWLLYGFQHPGVNLAALHFGLLGLLIWRYRQRLRSAPGVVLVVLAAGLGLALVEEPGRLAVILNVLSLISLAALGRAGWSTAPEVWVQRWLRFLLAAWWPLFRDARLVHAWRRRLPRRGCFLFLLNWTVPALIALGFVLLFRMANPVAEYLLGEAWNSFLRLVRDWRLPAPGRVLLWLGLLFGVWALLRFRFPQPLAVPHRPQPPPLPGATGPGWVVRTLVLCNLVFAAQNLMDSGFLWGGLRLPAGMSYASYAHRGAYPLVVAALLAGGFVLLAFRPAGAAARQRAARVLVYVWLGQTMVLTVSALWRLQLYVHVYALTRLRVAAAIWMVLVAVGLALILWRIWRGLPNAWLLRANFVVLLGTLYTGAFLDFDGFIARCNVDTELAGTRAAGLDLDYLAGLGPDSLPALRRLRDAAPSPAERTTAAACVAGLERDLVASVSNWRGWTWRRHRCLPPVGATAKGGVNDDRH